MCFSLKQFNYYAVDNLSPRMVYAPFFGEVVSCIIGPFLVLVLFCYCFPEIFAARESVIWTRWYKFCPQMDRLIKLLISAEAIIPI